MAAILLHGTKMFYALSDMAPSPWRLNTTSSYRGHYRFNPLVSLQTVLDHNNFDTRAPLTRPMSAPMASNNVDIQVLKLFMAIQSSSSFGSTYSGLSHLQPEVHDNYLYFPTSVVYYKTI